MTTNIQLARQVAQHVQLKSIALRSAHVDSFIPAGEPVSDPISVTQQHRCTFEELSLENAREIHVSVEFRCQASRNGSGEGAAAEAALLKLDATFILVYTLPLEAKYESECLQHFAELNGTYNAWPYWRELVQTATGRVGLSGVILPVYRPVSKKLAEKESTKGD